MDCGSGTTLNMDQEREATAGEVLYQVVVRTNSHHAIWDIPVSIWDIPVSKRDILDLGHGLVISSNETGMSRFDMGHSRFETGPRFDTVPFRYCSTHLMPICTREGQYTQKRRTL